MNDIQVLQIALAVLIILCAIAVYTVLQVLAQTNRLLGQIVESQNQPVQQPPFPFQFAFDMPHEFHPQHVEEPAPEPETKIKLEPKLQEDTTQPEEVEGK